MEQRTPSAPGHASAPGQGSIPRQPSVPGQGSAPRRPSALRQLRAAAPSLIKYQIVTKAIQSLVLFPLFWFATQQLLNWRGLPSLTNANIASFLLSPQGGLFILLVLFMLLTTWLMEIGGFLTLSARSIKGKKEASYHQVLWANLRTIPELAGPGLVLIVFIVGVVLPMAGTSLNISFLTDVRIPNFISSVIYSTPLYLGIYWTALAGLQVLAFFAVFTFHFMILGGMKTIRALRASFRMVRQNFWRFLGFMTLVNLLLATVALAVIIIAIMGVVALSQLLPATPYWEGFVGLLAVILLSVLATLFVFAAAPYELFFITQRYYTYLERRAVTEGDEAAARLAQRVPHAPEKTAPSPLDRLLRRRFLLSGFAALALVATAAVMAYAASFVTQAPQIALVGHRGGPGMSAVENSMEAIEYSISQGAHYVEVDIQRTKDGHYILNHDNTFARLAGDRRASTDMTLEQTRTLDLGATSGGRFTQVRVPSLDELLDATKGRIGIFLELKGATADERMVDDAVAAVKARDMLGEVVFMSLDYDIITYIEQTYPEATSGYTYFLAVGRTESLVGDYLILEEDAASRGLIDRIHAAGKKAAIWTVNTEDSMRKFVNWPIDAVITDYPEEWQEIARQRQEASPVDVMIDEFLEE